MAQNNKLCLELPFNRNVSYSQRLKAKEFWKYLEKENKTLSEDSDADQSYPLRMKGMWREQCKVFQEHGLDKVALAAYEKCKMCSTKTNYGTPDSTCLVDQPYEELIHDMQVFDEKLNDKTNASTEVL